MKTDGEPTSVQLQERIISNPPASDPQSNGLAEKAVQDVKAQLRVLKLGGWRPHRAQKTSGESYSRLDDTTLADAINRFSVGKDGRTHHFRLYMRPFKSKVFEFGEQVLAKPKRRVGVANQRTLVARWHEATWAVFCTRSGEHIVVLSDGGPALRVRTVRPASTSCVFAAETTADCPNPRSAGQANPLSERGTKGLNFGVDGGERLPRVFSTPSRRTESRFQN